MHPKTVKWKLDNRGCLVNKAYNQALVINDHGCRLDWSLASHGNEFRFCQPIGFEDDSSCDDSYYEFETETEYETETETEYETETETETEYEY
jgi:hypothetical protein